MGDSLSYLDNLLVTYNGRKLFSSNQYRTPLLKWPKGHRIYDGGFLRGKGV